MLTESCGYTFLTMVEGTNNEGIKLQPYLISRGKDKVFLSIPLMQQITLKMHH